MIRRAAIGALACLSSLPQLAAADVTERVMRVAGTSVHYKLVLPDGYDAAQEYRGIVRGVLRRFR